MLSKEALSSASIISVSEGEEIEIDAEGGTQEKQTLIEDEIDTLAELEEKYGSIKVRLTDFYLQKAWFE